MDFVLQWVNKSQAPRMVLNTLLDADPNLLARGSRFGINFLSSLFKRDAPATLLVLTLESLLMVVPLIKPDLKVDFDEVVDQEVSALRSTRSTRKHVNT